MGGAGEGVYQHVQHLHVDHDHDGRSSARSARAAGSRYRSGVSGHSEASTHSSATAKGASEQGSRRRFGPVPFHIMKKKKIRILK